MTLLTNITVTYDQWEQMHAHVSQEDPLEACGLIGGLNGKTLEIFPVANILKSSHRFQIDPSEQFRIFNLLETKSWDLLAIYHSHPHGPSSPSPTDITEAAYPNAANLIWSKQAANWGCKAFIISANGFQEMPMILVDKM